MNFIGHSFLVALFLTLSNITFSQESNVALIQMGEVMKYHPSFERSQARIDSLTEAFTLDIRKDQRRLQERLEMLLTKYNVTNQVSLDSIQAIMQPSDTLLLSMLLEDNTGLQQKTELLNNRLQAELDAANELILEDIDEAIEEYCEDHDIDMVFDLNKMPEACVYFVRERDITEEIIEMITNP